MKSLKHWTMSHLTHLQKAFMSLSHPSLGTYLRQTLFNISISLTWPAKET